MSTNDVPGAVAANRDELAMGCWAEAADGSMIVVHSTEGGNVVFSVFDLSKKADPVEYRSALAETAFKDTFTWKGGKGGSKDKWTWHDKTPFPWDRVMKAGLPDGQRPISADHILTAAQRVAESLKDMGMQVREERGGDYSHMSDRTEKGADVAAIIAGKVEAAIRALIR